MHKYMKIGKRNGKRKKKRGFLLTGPRGILAQPSAGARAGAGGPVSPPAGDDTMGAGPRASEEGENNVRG
jgi:hypothetical protein